MNNIRFDDGGAKNFILSHEISYLEGYLKTAHEMLHQKAGAGSEFTGWLDLPIRYDREEYKRIKEAAAGIQADADALVVIGIGGSYLGARAVIDALSHSFYNSLPGGKRKTPEIHFAGNSLSARYLQDLLEQLEGKRVCINVISKSGTTTEPAIAFRVFKEYMEKRYGKSEAVKRIYATTDKAKGALKKLADEEGYKTFVVPDDIGGRYSVLTAVGLLPIAVSGLDADGLMEGARLAYEAYLEPELAGNDCYRYAAARNALYRKGKTTEIMVNYEPSFHYFTEWWKQLYGESEGKDQKGIFPAGVEYTTDLHSLGQYVQDGVRNIFETVIDIGTPVKDFTIGDDKDNLDGLNFLSGKTLSHVNRKAMEGTMLAHIEGGVPNLKIHMAGMDESSLGSLIYFFEKACAVSGYLLGVNPFDQPGVEAYKKKMFELLGKPGY